MRCFQVTVRTGDRILQYFAMTSSAFAAYEEAAESQGDSLCGITVTPA